MATLEEIWPLFALRITSGPLELAPVHDDDISALVALAQGGIHDPAVMPFLFPGLMPRATSWRATWRCTTGRVVEPSRPTNGVWSSSYVMRARSSGSRRWEPGTTWSRSRVRPLDD
jgi:hypothetical protein